MTRRHNPQCLSDLTLDRWLAGELVPSEARRAEAHVASCEGCRSRRVELLESRHGFRGDAPPFAELVRAERGSLLDASAAAPRAAPVSSASLPGTRWLAGAVALAAAAAVALAVGVPWRGSEPLPGATRTKGGIASVSWVVRRGERVFAGHPDQPLRAGDAIRFTVSAREVVFVAIFGLDAESVPRVYFPEAERLAEVAAGRDQVLPMAIELDASPRDEHGYAVFCRGAEPVASVREAIARSPAAPPLPAGCTGERWSLPKERP